MKIGIIGGGQLGQMMAEAAFELNHEVLGLDPNPDCPLSHIAPMITAPYNDTEAFNELVSKCDVITYEFENVDLDLIHKYNKKIPQKAMALEKSRHRFVEKQFASSLDIPIPEVNLYKNIDDIIPPCIIKTTTGGYDGKGQFVIKDTAIIDAFKPSENVEYIIESFIPYDYEISCIATRDMFGNVEIQPIPVNLHKNGILFLSDVTTLVPNHVKEQAIDYTTKLIDQIDYIGTLAVEFFVVNEKVIFNEFAPRPHNSGHFTIEGSTVSQYKNHILAITGNKVEKAVLKEPTVMVNLIGSSISIVNRFKTLDNVCFHDYLKTNVLPDRKMGHVTITDSNIISLKKSLLQILEVIK